MQKLKQAKINYLEIYYQAHNNAIDILSESKILFENKKYARSYFLAFSALEEISKSQHAADVFTGFIKEEDFLKVYKEHKEKISRVEWAHLDANSYPHNQIWLGPEIEDIKKIAPEQPLWDKRQKSLYVDVINKKIVAPKDQISKDDAQGIIHIIEVAIFKILEITEYFGHQIGTKGFIK